MSNQKHDQALVIRTEGTLADVPKLEPLATALMRHIDFNFTVTHEVQRTYKRGFKKCAGKHCDNVVRKETMTNFRQKGKADYWFCPECTKIRQRDLRLCLQPKGPDPAPATTELYYGEAKCKISTHRLNK